MREGQYWDSIARQWITGNYSNQIYAEHKRNTYLRLLARWVDAKPSRTILKTDLFDEAFYVEQYLFDMSWADSTVGMDVSLAIVSKAKEAARQKHVDSSKYLCCDVTSLPFKDACFDYVISDSTLDHFPSETLIITALKDISRVLKAGGTLILILDNKSNFTYPPYHFIQLWMRLGLAPYFIGKTLSSNQLHHVMESLGLTIEDSTAIFHYPHPDGVIRGTESLVHRVWGNRLNPFMRAVFSWLENLEKRRTKFITGRYLAIKAVKTG